MKRILLLIFLLVNLQLTMQDGDLRVSLASISAQSYMYEELPEVEVIGNLRDCPWGCGTRLCKTEMDVHEQNCDLRMVECPRCHQKDTKSRIDKGWHQCGSSSNGGSGGGSGTSDGSGNQSGGGGGGPSKPNNNPNPSSKVKTPQVTIKSGVKIGDKEANLVRNLLKGLNVNEKLFVVTSCKRTLEQQVRAMLNNILHNGYDCQRRTYKGKPGEKVIEAYDKHLSFDQNFINMLKVASTVNPPYKLSRHIGIPGYIVFDIAQSTLSKSNIAAVIAALKSDPHVVKVLEENNCLHIEYKLD